LGLLLDPVKVSAWVLLQLEHYSEVLSKVQGTIGWGNEKVNNHVPSSKMLSAAFNTCGAEDCSCMNKNYEHVYT